MTFLITGTAGFIGNALALKLLNQGHEVVGIDNLNTYYSVELKKARLARLEPFKTYHHFAGDISDERLMRQISDTHTFSHIIHLAAQAGVRYSLEAPHSYAASNLTGFLNILELARSQKRPHLIFASTSSVYGANEHLPFKETDTADHPLSLYAATKRSNELMGHAYSYLFEIPMTGLRFFTVYGPWGRPDMAYYSFAKAIMEGHAIDVYNNGEMARDFTYIDDIVMAIIALSDRPAPVPVKANPSPHNSPVAPYAIYNIGNSQTVPLMTFIETLEQALGKEAIKNFKPMQPGDTKRTHADVSAIEKVTGVKPNTSIDDGLQHFADWFLGFHNLK